MRQLSAFGTRPEPSHDAWELAVANQAELQSLRREIGSSREELRALKGRAERFELEARRCGAR